MAPLRVILVATAGAFLSAQAGGLTDQELQAGQKLYVAKCAKCHQFHDPKAYAEADWRGWMLKMAKKAKLKNDQAELLTKYLNAYRAGELAAPPESARKR